MRLELDDTTHGGHQSLRFFNLEQCLKLVKPHNQGAFSAFMAQRIENTFHRSGIPGGIGADVHGEGGLSGVRIRGNGSSTSNIPIWMLNVERSMFEPALLACFPAPDATHIVENANDVALRPTTVGVSRRIAGLRIAALGAGAVDIHETIGTPMRRELHPASGAAEGDVDGGATLPIRRTLEVGGACPEKGIVAVRKTADPEHRVQGSRPRFVGRPCIVDDAL